MAEYLSNIKISILNMQWRDIADILLVAVLVYGLLKIMSKTRASQVLRGVGVCLIVAWCCGMLKLTAVTKLLDYILTAGAVFLVILFQPELRRAMEKIGRGRFFDLGLTPASNADADRIIRELQRAIQNMSIRKTGALIVFERKTGLRDIMESGTAVDARITCKLIENIFFVNTPLHDGAMIVKDGRIAAAGCFLPLSDNPQIASDLGTRHRAALGISEVSDCITIVVSEETGVISMANEGVLTRYIDSKQLKDVLESLFVDKTPHILGVRRKKEAQK